jgi:hypothetical protein
MKRRFFPLVLLVVFLAVWAVGSDARRSNSQPIPATPKNHIEDKKCSEVSNKEITEISECPLTGCSKAKKSHPFDTLLNEVKNNPDQPTTAPEDKDYSYLRELRNPTSKEYAEGDDRDSLKKLGEGKYIRVVAVATRVSKGSSETCNCNLTGMADKDNHIVLFDPDEEIPDPSIEDESQTAEFTPRVRLTHPNLKWSNLNARIQDADGALLVRVTGLQMFDSHHLFHDPLHRHNNWEIHPVFRLEFCPPGKTCKAGSNADWMNLKPKSKPKPKPQ